MSGQKHWVLLRGLGRDKRHWGEFSERFKQRFAFDTVTLLDTCGNGEFSQLKSPLAIGCYTDLCREALATSNKQVHLVALSLGGMIAMDWAARYNKEVQSLTLINTSAANLTRMTERINFATLPRLIWTLLISADPFQIEQAILAATSNLALTDAQVKRWGEYRIECATSTANVLRQLYAASRFKIQPIGPVPCKVLISANDRLVSANAGKAIAKYLQCPFVCHPSAGHDLPLDDPSWIIEQIALSLSGHETVKICP